MASDPTAYCLTFEHSNGVLNTTFVTVSEVAALGLGREGEIVNRLIAVTSEKLTAQYGHALPLYKVERVRGDERDLLTNAARTREGTQLVIRDQIVVVGRWMPGRNGRCYLVDEKGRSHGAYLPDDVFTLRPWEDIADEAEMKAEYDAEMAYERHLEDAGYEEARAQEAYELSLGIER